MLPRKMRDGDDYKRLPLTMLVALTVTLLIFASNIQYGFSASSSYSEYESKINTHLQEGNNALGAGDFLTAIQHYEACLALDPNERYCNINYATALIDMNELGEEVNDDTMKEERLSKATSILRHVLSLHPNDADAAFNLAVLLQDSSHSEETTRESAKLYQIAVEATDNDGMEDRWDALANLAAAKQELGEFHG